MTQLAVQAQTLESRQACTGFLLCIASGCCETQGACTCCETLGDMPTAVLGLSEPPLGSCGIGFEEFEILESCTCEQSSANRAFFTTGSSTGTLTAVVASTVSDSMISFEPEMSVLVVVVTSALPLYEVSELVAGRVLVEGATEFEVGTAKSELATSEWGWPKAIPPTLVCASIILWSDCPWASIRNCSSRWTYNTVTFAAWGHAWNIYTFSEDLHD